MFACLALASSSTAEPASAIEPDVLEVVARGFSPRVEVHDARLVTIDIHGLQRLLGGPAEIGRELQRDARDRGVEAHVAIAATRTAAMLLALARPGLTVVPAGDERRELAALPLAVLARLPEAADFQAGRRPVSRPPRKATTSAPASATPATSSTAGPTPRGDEDRRASAASVLALFRRWGLKTLGELALLPASALSARVGQEGLAWQRLARGEDLEPLVAMLPAAPIEETLDLEWPVEGLEPLSFLLPRLLEPLCDRLERLDQAAVTLDLAFRLATRTEEERRLQLPAPMRDAKVLRTLVLLHLESHPLPAGIDRLRIRVEPAPARIVQFSLLARALPFPEQMATLIARLSALMGERRVGAPVLVDTHRPGAFAMQAFSVTDTVGRSSSAARDAARLNTPCVVLRRFRLPVPARVLVQDDRPVRVTTERRGVEGGRVEASAGPWRTSGDWWHVPDGRDSTGSGGKPLPPVASRQLPAAAWNRDEWDVALGDGAIYRIYRDRQTDRWFIEGIVD